MIIFIHILIAISSVAYTSLLLIQPTTTKLHISYALITATLASGTYLTVVHPAQLLHACIAGLLYVSLVTVGTFMARHKLIQLQTQR